MLWPHHGQTGPANEATGSFGNLHPYWDDSDVHDEDVVRVLFVGSFGINTEFLCSG